MVAFNFASVDEAREFKMVIDEKIMLRKKREGKEF